ncbi:MAG: sugar ABC transporter substrate-binding protein [Beijerinckiaceae bacterium]
MPKLQTFARSLFLAASIMGVGGITAHAGDVPKLILTIDAFDSEYWTTLVGGAKDVAKSLNKELVIISSEYDGQRLISQFGALMQGGCENCAVVTDPTSAAFLKPLVDRTAEAGAKIVTLWNRPENMHPWDTHPEAWVMNTSYDGLEAGYKNGMKLCNALGASGGNIGVLTGISDNPIAKQRFAGIRKAAAECPAMKIVETQAGDWNQNKGYNIAKAWLAKYGDKLNGVFASNDAMALGVLAALRENKLEGKVLVTGSDGSLEVLKRIKDGTILSTVFTDPALQGATGVAFAYAAASGALDYTKLSHAQRDFNMKEALVTKDNVDQYIALVSQPRNFTYESLVKDLWANSQGEIAPGANE